jgi:ABC-type branched-subunit amino acid transport system substrate-binding protein
MTSARSRAICLVTALVVVLTACSNSGSSKSSPNTTSGGPVTTNAGNDLTKNVPVKASGVSSTEIHVGSIISKTNPTGEDFTVFNDGIKAYFDVVNSAGGIYGRKLKLTSERDDQTGNNLNQTQAMLSEDNVYAVFEAAELMTGAKLLQKKGIPTFGWNMQADWAGPPNFYPNIAPLCFSCNNPYPHMAPYVAMQTHTHRVGLIAYSVPQSSDACNGFARAFKQYGSSVDATVVYSDASLAFGASDYSAQVSQLKAKNVDFLATCLDGNGDIAVAKEMKRQGILDKVVFFHPNLYDAQLVKQNADVLEGGIVLVGEELAVENQPAIAPVQTFLDYAHAHNVPITELTIQGWLAALQFVNALKAAGPDFTWANLVGAWNQQTWYTGGGWIPAIDWTKNHGNPANVANRSQFECVNYVKIVNGAFVPVWNGGGTKPWVCFDGHNPTVWQTPVNVSFTGEPFTMAEAQKSP